MPRQYRTKLQKLIEENSTEPFEPSEIDVVKWFRILDREIFDRKLDFIPTIEIKVRRNTHASYVYCDEFDDWTVNKLHINKRYDTK
jgi:hypothetical protein